MSPSLWWNSQDFLNDVMPAHGAPSASTIGHQPVSDSTLGSGSGTGPFHGARSRSIALRGGGYTTAPGPDASGSSASAATVHANVCAR